MLVAAMAASHPPTLETADVLPLLKAYKTTAFEKEPKSFIVRFRSLREAYRRSRESLRVPLAPPDGSVVYLSPGEHNVLQVAIVEKLGPRFAWPGFSGTSPRDGKDARTPLGGPRVHSGFSKHFRGTFYRAFR